MRQATISKGGQISIPADIRRRWGTTKVVLRDEGGALVVLPLPEDPIAAARGSLLRRPTEPSSDEARRQVRLEESATRRRVGSRP